MQTYTFTESQLYQLLANTILRFSLKPNVYDFSGGSAALTVDEIITGLNDSIPFDGSSLLIDDTGNAEFDAAIEPAF